MIRNILSNGAVIVAGMVSVPAIVTSLDTKLPAMPPLPVAGYVADPRLPLLERFFDSGDAPAKAFSHVFLSEADENELDWRLLPSISWVETTGGKAARNNNMFGWDCGRAEFPTMSDGIRKVAHFLSHASQYRDKDLDEVLETYNPNVEYSRKVRSVMERIAPAE